MEAHSPGLINAPPNPYYYFIDFAATTIQRHWRGYRERKVYWTQVRASELASAAQGPLCACKRTALCFWGRMEGLWCGAEDLGPTCKWDPRMCLPAHALFCVCCS